MDRYNRKKICRNWLHDTTHARILVTFICATIATDKRAISPRILHKRMPKVGFVLLICMAAAAVNACQIGSINLAFLGETELCCRISKIVCSPAATVRYAPSDCSSACQCPWISLDVNGDPIFSLTGASCTECAPGWAQDENELGYVLPPHTKTCQVPIDECASNPCQNGGVCNDEINGYTCDCGSSGMIGTHCEINGAEGGTTGSVPGGQI